MRKVVIFMIQFYRALISPCLGPCCRFIPTCSQYALEAVEKRGALKGCALSLARVCRCHPWNPGGYDPPPEK